MYYGFWHVLLTRGTSVRSHVVETNEFHGRLLDVTVRGMEKMWICVILINSFWSQVPMSYCKKNIRDSLHAGIWTSCYKWFFILVSPKLWCGKQFGFMILMASLEDTAIHFSILLDNNICKMLYGFPGAFKNIISCGPHISANVKRNKKLSLYFKYKGNGAPKA